MKGGGGEEKKTRCYDCVDDDSLGQVPHVVMIAYLSAVIAAIAQLSLVLMLIYYCDNFNALCDAAMFVVFVV